jgi:hypothetical protein
MQRTLATADVVGESCGAPRTQRAADRPAVAMEGDDMLSFGRCWAFTGLS